MLKEHSRKQWNLLEGWYGNVQGTVTNVKGCSKKINSRQCKYSEKKCVIDKSTNEALMYTNAKSSAILKKILTASIVLALF